jgi:hypothetical protein
MSNDRFIVVQREMMDGIGTQMERSPRKQLGVQTGMLKSTAR